MKPVAHSLSAAGLLMAGLFASGTVQADETTTPALIGLTRAIGVAEKFMTAHVLEGRMDTRDGQIVYRIDLAQGERLYRLTIDGLTGEILQARSPWLSGLWFDLFAANRMRVAETLTPAQTILTLFEQRTGGAVQQVALDLVGGHPFYEVCVTTAAGTADVTLDALTGERAPADR